MKGTLALAIAAGLFASACVTDRSKPPQAPGFSWIVQASGTNASLRGVSVVDDRTAWASGSKGTVLLRGAVNTLHNPCCSTSTSRAI
jgi:hypothetical protein